MCISYQCPVRDCNQVVLHEIVHITDDLKHDAHLVKKILTANVQLLQKHRVQICKIIEFTDQAPSQYKNKSSYCYLAQETIPTQRNFFGVRHGKGPCDACAGRVKSQLANVVKTEKCVINNAKSCFEAARDNLESQWPAAGEYIYILVLLTKLSLHIKRPDTSKWKDVKDTQSHLHSIMNSGNNLKVNEHDIICICPACLHREGDCKNGNYVDNWRDFDMKIYEETPADLSLSKSCKICKSIGCREQYQWHDALTILASKNTCDELHDYVKKNPLPFLDFHIIENLTDSDRVEIDLVALHYKPQDVPEGYTPFKIYGDGNCYPRTLSFICFKNQNSHKEMCVCLVYEAVLTGWFYVNNRYF